MYNIVITVNGKAAVHVQVKQFSIETQCCRLQCSLQMNTVVRYSWRIYQTTRVLLMCKYTEIGRKNETRKIFVELLQINQDIPNLVSNTQPVYNYEHLAHTGKTRFKMSQTFCKRIANIISVSFFLPIPVHAKLTNLLGKNCSSVMLSLMTSYRTTNKTTKCGVPYTVKYTTLY